MRLSLSDPAGTRHPWLSALLLPILALTPCPLQADPTDFAQYTAAQAVEAAEKNHRVVAGEAPGWLFLSSELKHTGTADFWNHPESMRGGDPVAAIIAYHEALKALGITLVVVPVPAKAAIYPDKLSASHPSGTAMASTPVFEKLAAAGVTAVNLEPVFLRERENQKVYCEQDSHWSPWACHLAADQICALPAVQACLPVQPPAAPQGEEISITGDLANVLEPNSPPHETIMAFPAAMPPVPPDDNSPVILLGDSHTIVFSEAGGTIKNHTTGSGLRDHLQARLGTPLAVIATAASGADGARGLLARKAASTPTPDFWNNRKLVVWCFSAREFTQGRWRKIPAQPGRF